MNQILFDVYIGLKNYVVYDVIILIIDDVRRLKYHDDKPFIDMETFIINTCKNNMLIHNYSDKIVYCNNDIRFTFERQERTAAYYDIKLHFYGIGYMKETIKNKIQSLLMLKYKLGLSSIEIRRAKKKNFIYVRKFCNNREYKDFDKDYAIYKSTLYF